MYESVAIPTKISATSRVAVKIRDNFYTIEYSEERTIPEEIETNMELERQYLFDDVNAVVDQQIKDILDTFKK